MKFPSKIFIDGGDPAETAEAVKLLGFLDGQTTNPTLIARNLLNRSSHLTHDSHGSHSSHSISEDQALEEYKKIVQAMSQLIPDGSISIQVFANLETKSGEMLSQARERNAWIPNASIKFPCTHEGLKAASLACREMPINITLVFSQPQAAAVYGATLGAKFPVFISPFVGRLDDRGENGMMAVSNIIKMYQNSDKHVEVLTASTRNLGHILYALYLGSDIITIPFKVFKEWADTGFQTPEKNFSYAPSDLAEIPYEDLDLGKIWTSFDLHHDLTEAGILKFSSDWTSLVVTVQTR